MEAPRGRVAAGQQRGKVIDYRHLLPALRRKPGAFARWVLRDEMFPRDEYRRTWVAELPEVKVELPTLADYDTLLRGVA